MPNPMIENMPGDDERSFSSIDLSKLGNPKPLKIDYSNVRNLEYVDLEGRPAQTFTDFLAAAPPAEMRADEQVDSHRRPARP